MALLIYNLVFPLLFLLYLPFYLAHLIRRGGLDWTFLQRLGLFSRTTASALRRLDRPVWIHAVSVGETVAAISFIRRFQERNPDCDIVLSSTTTTGHDLARRKSPKGVTCIYCPLDIYPAVRRTLTLVEPAMLIIFEVEIWPNLILQSARRGTRVVLVNGRMSDRSSRSYARWGGFFRHLFGSFDALCMQTDEDAARVRRVVEDDTCVTVCNTMKFDQIPDAEGADKTSLFDDVFGSGERLVFCAGSTHPGEETMVCDALCSIQRDTPHVHMVLVPRHHERCAEVEQVLVDHGLSFRLLVPRVGREEPQGPVAVLLVNTTGELMNFYAASDVAYVGKSLAGNEGGHNIIEPAIFGKAILHGDNMQNFRAVAAIFREAEAAMEVTSEAEFCEALRDLLADPAQRSALGARARAVVERCRGAIDRTLDRIEPFLEKRP